MLPVVSFAATSRVLWTHMVPWSPPPGWAPAGPTAARAASSVAAIRDRRSMRSPFSPELVQILCLAARGRPGTGAVAPGRHGTYGDSREPVCRLYGGGDEMAGEHVLDPGSARAPVDPVDHALALHEHQCRHDRYPETFGELRLLLDVHPHHEEPRALLPGKVREQALHTSRRARTLGPEEDKQRLGVVSHSVCPPGLSLRGEGPLLFPANRARKLHSVTDGKLVLD